MILQNLTLKPSYQHVIRCWNVCRYSRQLMNTSIYSLATKTLLIVSGLSLMQETSNSRASIILSYIRLGSHFHEMRGPLFTFTFLDLASES